MDYKKELDLENSTYLPNLSIDLVIIGYSEDVLKCLLLKVGEKWLLPGGYIKRNESVDDAVTNILKQRTGLEGAYLKFLSVFGDKNRQFKSVWKQFIEKIGLEWSDDYWFNDRFVTLTYYSLVNLEKTHPKVGHFDEAFDWFDFNHLPDMWMDHQSIVLTARKQLQEDIHHELNIYNLLPEIFTMPDLYQLHQTILGEKIDRSRFQKKMLATGIFERLPKLKTSTPGRNPYQYRIKQCS